MLHSQNVRIFMKMKKTTLLRKMQIAIGVIGLIFFATADLLQGHQLSVGLRQLAGLTVSAIIILAGISNH